MHAARRVANDGSLVLGVVSGSDGAGLGDDDDDGSGGRVEEFGMTVPCNLMVHGLRPFNRSRMKSYSVS